MPMDLAHNNIMSAAKVQDLRRYKVALKDLKAGGTFVPSTDRAISNVKAIISSYHWAISKKKYFFNDLLKHVFQMRRFPVEIETSEIKDNYRVKCGFFSNQAPREPYRQGPLWRRVSG
jgi:hypothetical protein